MAVAEHQQLRNYEDIRKEIYGPIRDRFTWEWEKNELHNREYALASVHTVSEGFIQELHTATDKMGQVFSKTVSVLEKAPDETLLELGIPAELLTVVRYSPLNLPTLIGRFDFARTPEGLKLLELNADTPCAILEAFLANGAVCDYFGVKDPNKSNHADIKLLFNSAIKKYKQLGYRVENVFFSSVEYHDEDKGTTEFLLAESGLNGKFVPLKDLRLCNDGLYALIDGELERVDVLYRLHPLGNFVQDKSEDGYPTGIECLNLVLEKKLALINPPNALIAQTKALQALMWALHENQQFYTDDEHAAIEKYMIPTYFDNKFAGQSRYVEKAIFGREGCAVAIFEGDGTIFDKDGLPYYWDQQKIYQQYVEMDIATVESIDGIITGKILWGSFYMDGKSSAITARLGGNITNIDAKFLPIGIREEKTC